MKNSDFSQIIFVTLDLLSQKNVQNLPVLAACPYMYISQVTFPGKSPGQKTRTGAGRAQADIHIQAGSQHRQATQPSTSFRK